MNKLILTTLTVALGAASSLAMPTKADLKKAQPLVNELMSPSLSAFKSARGGAKTAAAEKVADASGSFAKEAETEAAKFLLLKGAVTYYVRAEKYDKAADSVKTLQSEIKDVPPSVIAEITGKATSRISESKAPALYSLYRAAKLQVHASEEAKSLAAKLKKATSSDLRQKYAEVLAISGDWKNAYAEFSKVNDGKLKMIVESEAKGEAKNVVSGEFWWNYEPKTKKAEDFFKAYAIAFYRKALAADEVSGLKRNIIEQRIADIKVESFPSVKRGLAIATRIQDALYCVIDLSGGPDATEYPVSYLVEIPEGGWTDEYKTRKLVLTKIKAGRDPKGRYSISTDFYIGVYVVTVKQWEMVMGTIPSGVDANASSPLHSVSWNDFRGLSDKKRNNIAEPSDNSFIGRLAKKTHGMGFDLPTEAQWELAYREGLKNKTYVSGGDMWERCLDDIGMLSGKDPVGSVGGGSCGNRQIDDAKGNAKKACSNSCNAYWGRSYRIFLKAQTTTRMTDTNT